MDSLHYLRNNDLVMSFATDNKGDRHMKNKNYCILRPLTCVEGLHPHAALVFSVDGKGVFRVVKERRLSNEIFAEYYSAMQRAQKKE